MKFLIVARLTCERLFGFLFVFATNTNACCLHIYSMYSYSRYTGEKKHGIGKFTWLIGLSEGEREKKREWQQQRLSPINARSLIAVRLLNRAFTRRVRYSGNAEHSTFVLSEFLGILWKKKKQQVSAAVSAFTRFWWRIVARLGCLWAFLHEQNARHISMIAICLHCCTHCE